MQAEQADEEPIKGVLCHVLRSALGDAGSLIGSRHNSVILLGDGVPQDHEADEESPAVRLDHLVFNSIDTWLAIPVASPGRKLGYSFGGNYIVPGGGGRGLPFDHPIKLLDRIELPDCKAKKDETGIVAYHGDELVAYYPGHRSPTVAGVLRVLGQQRDRGSTRDLTLWRDGRLVGYIASAPGMSAARIEIDRNGEPRTSH